MNALPNISFIIEATAATTQIHEMIDRIPVTDSEEEKGKDSSKCERTNRI